MLQVLRNPTLIWNLRASEHRCHRLVIGNPGSMQRALRESSSATRRRPDESAASRLVTTCNLGSDEPFLEAAHIADRSRSPDQRRARWLSVWPSTGHSG